MATISNTPRPGYVWDSTDNVWYPIGTGPHTHADYITSGSAINPTIVDAKGDIIAATAADTVARLAVGSNDQVLTADSSTATGLKWATPAAGGMTLLSTTNLSGISTTVSSISGSYTDLLVIINNPFVNSATKLRIEANSTSGIGFACGLIGTTTNQDDQLETQNLPTATTASTCNFVLSIKQYANSTYGKPFYFAGTINSGTTSSFRGGVIGTTSAISSIKFFTFNGTSTFSGGQVLIYGVK